jgi:hypothetical protein
MVAFKVFIDVNVVEIVNWATPNKTYNVKDPGQN